MKTQCKIYLLADPRSGAVRYVGQTSQKTNCRLLEHLSEARRSDGNHRLRWVRQLLALGLRPLIVVLEITDDPDAREIFWIDHFRRTGSRLTNSADGGGGCRGVIPSEETRAKLKAVWTDERRAAKSKWASEQRHSEAIKAKIGAGNKGKKMPPMTPELREIRRIGSTGRKASDETRAKLRRVLKGIKKRPMCEAGRETHRRNSTGRKHTQEAKDKVRAARLGKKRGPLTPEWRAKIGAAQKGRKKSAEELSKLDAANKARARLTDDEVREMRRQHAAGEAGLYELMSQFKSSRTNVQGILAGKRRADVV